MRVHSVLPEALTAAVDAALAGVTRFDEPGYEDPARHRGTLLRLIARDTEVAARLAEDVRAAGLRAFMVAGDHEYGIQLDGQLDHVGLLRAADAAGADLVVLCGLAAQPEVAEAAGLGPPVVAFDGVQGGVPAMPNLSLMLPFTPEEDTTGRAAATRAATLISDAVAGGARDRAALLSAMRIAGPFDEHGDPVDPPVWLYRVAADSSLPPDRPL